MPRPLRLFVLILCLASGAALAQTGASGASSWRDATPEQRRLDAAAFEGFDAGIADRLYDVQSVVVILQGRQVYAYHRDGNPDALRDTQSVAKSALAVLVGVALQRGDIASIDQPLVELVPAWRTLNPDARSQAITLRHLLSMTAGFAVDDPTGTAEPLAPEPAWARPLRHAPGQAFAYDNSVPGMIAQVLATVTRRPLADYARDHLVTPLGLREPRFGRGVALRTDDMARLGQLVLQDGRWADRPLLPADYVAQLRRAQSAGGAPAGLPYGLGWWVASAGTYFASGYAGQLIWVHEPLGLVVATTSTVSPASQARGQAVRLVRGRIFQAAQRLAAGLPPVPAGRSSGE